MMEIFTMAKQVIKKTKKTIKKSSTPAKIVKDSKGKSHCSKCGAYITK